MWKSGEITNRTRFWSDRSKKWLPLSYLLHDFYPNRDRLDQSRRAGIKRIKIIGSGLDESNCDRCRNLFGTYPIDTVPELPPKGCTCNPWCGCITIAVE